MRAMQNVQNNGGVGVPPINQAQQSASIALRTAKSNSRWKSAMTMAMRLKVAFESSGINYVDISKGFQGWLIFAAASLIANATLGDTWIGFDEVCVSHGGHSCSSSPSQRDLQEWKGQAVRNLP